MKAIAICFLVALAIVATIAVLPVSGWIFRNQVDLITSSTTRPEFFW